jgi:hypothetical protein
MIQNDEWLTPDTSFDPNSYNGLPVKIKTKIGTEVVGTLKFEGENGRKQIKVKASYNRSPFPDIIENKSFYLTQDQLNEFHDKPTSCVLIAST